MYFQIRGAGILSAVAVALSMGAGQAQADNKLFATDILDAGKMDATVSLQRDQAKTALLAPEVPYAGSSKLRSTMAALSARYGVGAQTQLQATVVYGTQRGHISEDTFGSHSESRDSATGVVGSGLAVTHGLSFASVQPLTLAVGMGLRVMTDKNLEHKSHNNLSAHAAAGWQFQNGYKASSSLTWTVPEHADERKTLEWNVGGWLPLADGFILEPEAGVVRMEGTTVVPDRYFYDVILGAHVQVAPRTYVSPSFRLDYAPTRDYTRYGVNVREKSYINQSASISLYHLF